jgi:hypothetical protein
LRCDVGRGGSGDAGIESGPVVPADVLPVSERVRRFDSVEAEAAEILLRNSQSSDSWLIYESGYYWEGYVSMYEATGDTRFLDAVWVSIDNWMDRALPCDQVPGSTNEPQFRGWSSKTHPQGANGTKCRSSKVTGGDSSPGCST